jgi:hypothetical protein
LVRQAGIDLKFTANKVERIRRALAAVKVAEWMLLEQLKSPPPQKKRGNPIDEGIRAFLADNLTDRERLTLEFYIANADHDFKRFPPRFPLYSRDEFIKKVFYKWARRGAMIVGFNLVFDLSRLALEWPKANRGEWSLLLVKNADGSENKFYPRVVITPHQFKEGVFSFLV